HGAQPTHGAHANKPKPPETTAPAASSGAANASAAPASGDGGPVPAPGPVEMTDGGVRASPLNPAPNEFPSPAPSGSGAPLGVANVDYDKLLGDIAALRARVAAVGDNLFHSRLAVAIRTEGDHARIGRLAILLDDGVVYTAPPSFRPEDPVTVF